MIDRFAILLNRKLTRLPDLSRFHFLRELWLNNNTLSGRSLNCCLTELYLQNNNIPSISGALKHLTCLRVLLLHNNRLRGLEDTTKELRRMQQLHTATFFLNPISHEAEYRLHISGTRVGKPPARHRVLQSVAFGRRATASSSASPGLRDSRVINMGPSSMLSFRWLGWGRGLRFAWWGLHRRSPPTAPAWSPWPSARRRSPLKHRDDTVQFLPRCCAEKILITCTSGE
uniref:U2A'/phosphoprotein 32 family A C-terminal domain-containing protein n=1 Tax=Gasterosteus aculeatus aculeatus TaxID=481459 RepID=A0AAQ4PKP9_GASAC